MDIIKTIVEIIFSPFTILFRSKPAKNPNKSVNPILVAVIAIILTCAILFLVYYPELFKA